MSGVIQCAVRAIDEQGGRLEVIRRTQLVPAFPPEVMQTCLIAVSDRESVMEVDGVRYAYHPHSVMFFRAGQSVTVVNTTIPARGTTYCGIELTEASFAAALGEAGVKAQGFPGLRAPVLHDPEFGAGLMSHYGGLLEGASDAELHRRLRLLLTSISSHRDAVWFERFNARAMRPDIYRAVRHIQSNFGAPLSLEDVAREAHLSVSRLGHVFQETVGVSPHYYLIQYRIQRAKSMLCRRMPLAQVACSTGFADQAHFTRQFKRMTALTPGQYVGKTRGWAG